MMWKFVTAILLFVFLLLVVYFFRDSTFLFFKNLQWAFDATFHHKISYDDLLAQCVRDVSLGLEKEEFDWKGLHYIKVKIFSLYPFNNYARIVIDGGENLNLKVGMPVLINQETLLGRIVEVRKQTSLVETVFSPEWKSAVFIGTERIKGILEGGTAPMVKYVVKGSVVNKMDTVYNADSRFPMDLKWGNIADEKESSNWRNFTLSFSYNIDGLTSLLVLTNFE